VRADQLKGDSGIGRLEVRWLVHPAIVPGLKSARY
jgi:hypothetical protein